MDASEKNPRSAGNIRVNAAHERRKLKSHPVEPVSSTPLPVPARTVSPDHPQFRKAERNARERFGEFVESFELRQTGDTFAVQAPFRDDFGTEYLWVRVRHLDDDNLHGTLDNEPKEVKSIRAGQTVKVPRDLVNDWLVMQNGQVLGGFTLALARDAA